MAGERPRVFRFAVFEMDVKAGEMRKHGRRVRLQDKPFQLLQSLVENAGDVVSRDELRDKLWPADTFVDFDNGLNNAVNKVRRVLGDSPAAPKYVETVGRRGYRFIGSVDSVPPAVKSMPHLWRPGSGWAPAPHMPAIRSIAVLPLANLSEDRDQEYFSDGMTDALISQIAGIRALRVISRQSTIRFKGSRAPMSKIARALDVDGVIDGSVVRGSDGVRVSVRLVHAPTDSHLWSGEWNRPLEDAIVLQSEIARAVAQEVRAAITSEEAKRFRSIGTIDPDAHDAYLRGRYFWNRRTRDGLLRAVEYFRKAIAIAPAFAEAHAAIAESYGPLGYLGFLPPDEASPVMRAAATAALSIDPDLVGGLTALAACCAFHEWKLLEAERLFHRAIAVNPNYALTYMWYGQLLENTCRQAENVAARRQAIRLDPLNLRAGAALGLALYLAGDVDEGIARLQSTLELDPNWVFARNARARIEVERGDPAKAVPEFRAIGALGPLGHALALSGNLAGARATLEMLQSRARSEYISPFQMAMIQVGLGDVEGTLCSLERAYEIRAVDLSEVKVDARFAPLAEEPRYQALLRQMGLSPGP